MISVVLPTYNEKANIGELVYKIIKILTENKYSFEIIVVDDNSPDKTWMVVEDMKRKEVKVIRRMKKKSLPGSIAQGIRQSKGNIIVWMDCDLSMPSETIPILLNSLNKCDVIIGSRYVSGGKDLRGFDRVITSFLFNLFASFLLGFNVRDYDSGFVAVKKKVFKKVNLTEKGYGEYFVEFIYKCRKNNFKIMEIPYTFTDRKRGKSKISPNFFYLLYHGIRYGVKVIWLRFF